MNQQTDGMCNVERPFGYVSILCHYQVASLIHQRCTKTGPRTSSGPIFSNSSTATYVLRLQQNLFDQGLYILCVYFHYKYNIIKYTIKIILRRRTYLG
jgi:hypothetical protein